MSSQWSKSCVITGASEGIGHALVKQLAQQDMAVYLTARNADIGCAAKTQIEKEIGEHKNILCQEIDVLDESSIQNAANAIHKAVGNLDYLVCNAAVSTRHTEVTERSAREVIDTNFYGYLKTFKAFENKMKQGGKVVFVGSNMGILALQHSSMELRKRVLDPKCSIDDLCKLAEEFVECVQQNKNLEQSIGFKPFVHSDTQWDYSFSKLLVLGLARCISRDYKNLIVTLCHPGYVKTKLTLHADEAPLMPDEGAAPIAKCVLECNESGHYFDREKCAANLLTLSPEEIDKLC